MNIRARLSVGEDVGKLKAEIEPSVAEGEEKDRNIMQSNCDKKKGRDVETHDLVLKLGRRNVEIRRLNKEVKENEGIISHLKNEAAENGTVGVDVEGLKHMVDEKDGVIERLNEEIGRNEVVILELRKEVENSVEKIKEMSVRETKKDMEISKWEIRGMGKDIEIRELKAMEKKKNDTFDGLKQMLTERDAVIETLKKKCSEDKAGTAELTKELEKAITKIAGLSMALDKKNMETKRLSNWVAPSGVPTHGPWSIPPTPLPQPIAIPSRWTAVVKQLRERFGPVPIGHPNDVVKIRVWMVRDWTYHDLVEMFGEGITVEGRDRYGNPEISNVRREM